MVFNPKKFRMQPYGRDSRKLDCWIERPWRKGSRSARQRISKRCWRDSRRICFDAEWHEYLHFIQTSRRTMTTSLREIKMQSTVEATKQNKPKTGFHSRSAFTIKPSISCASPTNLLFDSIPLSFLPLFYRLSSTLRPKPVEEYPVLWSDSGASLLPPISGIILPFRDISSEI